MATLRVQVSTAPRRSQSVLIRTPAGVAPRTRPCYAWLDSPPATGVRDGAAALSSSATVGRDIVRALVGLLGILF